MTDTIRPTDADQLCIAIGDAGAVGAKLRLRGGGSKDAVGAPTPEAQVLDMGAFAGVIDYDPAELVLTVGAATPLAEVQALVATEGQMLAFDPFDHGAMLGGEDGRATIGGVVAAGVAGPGRLSRGGARDHLLGLVGVSGRGERFVAGAKVVKNVTGYDLPKMVAGSWGRIAAVTEMTLKVLPAPRALRTLAIRGLTPAAAIDVMARALGSAADVSAVAHLPDQAGGPLTVIRLDGFPASIDARTALLMRLIKGLAPHDADPWDAVRTAATLPAEPPLWRLVVPASRAAGLVATVGGDWLLDWGGALVWLASDDDPASIRSAATRAGGHAILLRAPSEMRARVPALHPQPAALAALEERVRRAFDPLGVFDTGRF